MKFDGCFCTGCLSAIQNYDAETWITRGICQWCRKCGREGVPVTKDSLTASELEYARLHRFPIYRKSMVKRSLQSARTVLHADVEELTPEALTITVAKMQELGWQITDQRGGR